MTWSNVLSGGRGKRSGMVEKKARAHDIEMMLLYIFYSFLLLLFL